VNSLAVQLEQLISQAEACTEVEPFGAAKAKLRDLIQKGQSPSFTASAALQTAISGITARLQACEDNFVKSQAVATAQAQVQPFFKHFSLNFYIFVLIPLSPSFSNCALDQINSPTNRTMQLRGQRLALQAGQSRARLSVEANQRIRSAKSFLISRFCSSLSLRIRRAGCCRQRGDFFWQNPNQDFTGEYLSLCFPACPSTFKISYTYFILKNKFFRFKVLWHL
jgi:hypothetical protein